MSLSRPARRTLITGLGAGAAAALVPGGATASSPHRRPLVGPAADARLHVMTFNIRRIDPGTKPGSPDWWSTRRPALVSLLRTEQPTLLGAQEVEHPQLSALEEALPAHRMVGTGREGGSRGEYSPILYDARRLTVLEWDQRWLSDTPDVIGSATWGNRVTRCYTWARLRDARTGRELVLLNTHLDHQSEPSRVRSARVLAGLRAAHPGLPVLVTGDFNSPAGTSEAHRLLTTDGPYRDTWLTAARRLTPAWGTLPGYRPPVEGAKRIDWVLTTPDVTVEKVGINVARPGGVWPSDHVPVQALVRL